MKKYLMILLLISLSACTKYVGTEHFCQMYEPVPKIKLDVFNNEVKSKFLIDTDLKGIDFYNFNSMLEKYLKINEAKFKQDNISILRIIDENNLVQKDLCFAEYGFLLPVDK